MKVIRYTKYGSPDVIKVVNETTPEPKEGEYRIRIKATTVTPTDCAVRKADPAITRLFAGLLRPRDIPGDSIAGVIDAIGKGVTEFAVGDEVYGTSAPKSGAHAEYICLSSESPIVRKPEQLSFEEAAGISDGAITALPFLRDVAKLQAEQRILINGASGAIGTYAIQLSKYYGAKVTAVCSGKNVQRVKELGADEVVDYTKDDFTKVVSKYDVIFDAVGKSSFNKCEMALTSNGIYMTTVPNLSVMLSAMMTSIVKGKKATFAATGLRKGPEKKKDFLFFNEQIRLNQLKSIIDKTFDFDQFKEAHTYVDKGHKVGNVVIRL